MRVEMELNKWKSIESPVGAEIVLDGKRYINFAGSSYLGLAGNQEIIEAGVAMLRTSGCGAQLARHYQISTHAHLEAESEAAKFFDTQAALYIPGGYYFGLVAIAAMRAK